MNPQTTIGQTHSLWHTDQPLETRPPLDRDTLTDVCIVGAGIAGLATAYQFAREGRRVVVLDDGPIGGGETGRTTAHLSSVIDDRFWRIEHVHGAEAARFCYDSHDAAIQWYEEVVAREGIACDFERLDGYLFLPPGEKSDLLTMELAAANRAGFTDVEMVSRAPLPSFDTGPCLRFPRQAQVHPLSFLSALAAAIERWGGRIFCGTHARQVEQNGNGSGLAVRCDHDMVVRASAVVFATNSPINDIVTIHTKQHPYRTYALALPIERGAVPRNLYWDTSQTAGDAEGPYHYVRVQPGRAGDPREYLIVGGEDHKTGQPEDTHDRWGVLAAWARERFPVSSEPAARWSGQVMEPVDYVAFIGRNPTGPDNVYIATGDSGMGMTHGAIAGLLLGDLIAGRSNPWAQLYDPSRRTLRTAGTFARENLNMAAQYFDWLKAGDVSSTDHIATESGAIVRRGLKLVACYRDGKGDLHECSAVCPHLGGVVRWNAAESTWDCPCHGSRFDAFGKVLNGPAISPLTPVESGTPQPV